MRKEKTNYSVENLMTLLKYCQLLICCGQRWHTAILVRLGLKGDREEGQGCTKAPLLMQRHFNNTSKGEWQVGFGCGSKWAEEEELGLMLYFRVLAVPATPQHNEVIITSVREAFSNSSTAS